MSDLLNNFNPDVLNCIANLSNDEVFTSPVVANAMLDLLPENIWMDRNAKFLDPCTKSGVFLREITKRLLEAQIPNYQVLLQNIDNKKKSKIGLDGNDEVFLKVLQETIDHILHNQVFGIGITELTSLLSRRSLYCSKYPNCIYSISRFESAEGNVRFKKVKHTWKDGRCLFCGATQSEYDRDESLETHAYEFLHVNDPKEIFKNMKFDVIVGNPPYQLSDGGSGPSAMPLYNKFVEASKKLNPKYITMIIPSRWFAGGKGLDDFREDMLNDRRIKYLVDYPNSSDCFAGVDIAGGVNYFLWDSSYDGDCTVKTIRGNQTSISTRALNEFDIFIRSNESISIIHKIEKSKCPVVESVAFTRNPFGFESKARGNEIKSTKNYISLVHSQGIGYVSLDDVQKNKNSVDKWKVTIGKLVPSNGEVGVDPEKGYNAITVPKILKPNEVITDSYLVIATFNTENEAINFSNYMKLKFPRFLMHETYSSMNISKSNFRFVPFLDFTKKWSDNELYKLFDLGEDEIAFVEKLIRPMEDR